MQTVVVFNKVGYDPFIDFIKAYAIICVLIGHTFPFLDEIGYGLWAGMQVPLFILVQSFHALKKESKFQFKKTFWRVFAPFIVVETIIYILLLVAYPNLYNWKGLAVTFLYGGGLGPGSYYPWIYLQMAILLPMVYKWTANTSKIQLGIIFLVICEGIELLSSLFDLPDNIHRLLAVRYLFLIWLAWIWVKEGIIINTKTTILSLISFISIIYFEYFSVDDEPLFYNTAWKFHRWPCYYYVAIWGGDLLCAMYQQLTKHQRVLSFTKSLAKCSYELFLVQMAICVLCPSFEMISNIYLRLGFRIIVIWALSIFGGYLLNKWYNAFLVKYIH